MYYSNKQIEEFDRYAQALGFEPGKRISDSQRVFIDLEQYIFADAINQSDPLGSFADHRLSTQELNNRFNKLLGEFNDYEAKYPSEKQYRFLSIKLIDIRSHFDEEIYQWSYFNHKFISSQGQDQEAMNEWHQRERLISVDKISRFKALREGNLAFLGHIIKNHKFFDEIVISGVSTEGKFGWDIAEQQYLHKIIKENQGQTICRIVEPEMHNLVLNLVKKNLQKRNLKLKGNIASTSKKLNPADLLMARSLLGYLGITETNIKEADFVFLINDLDILGVIPIVDTDKPILVADLSQESTPNFAYLLLKDEGFFQIYSYAKKQSKESPVESFIRSTNCGMMSWLLRRKFSEQIAVNYMDDYFVPLAKSLDKNLKEFQAPIELLKTKLTNNA